MSWFDIVKEDGSSIHKAFPVATTNDPREYLEDYTKGGKIRWHLKRASHYMQQQNFNRAKDYRGWAEKMKSNPDPKFVLDMEGNIITVPLTKYGRVSRFVPAAPKSRKIPLGLKNEEQMQRAHDKYGSKTWTLEDMIEFKGKVAYRKWLRERIREDK